MPLNITILGLNALGASLGLALGTLDQDALPGGRPVITGWDADKRTLSTARGRLMIDREAADIAGAVGDADVVFVCTPLADLAATFTTIAPQLKRGTIVTDVQSTKTSVLALAETHLPRTVAFIGGHPLVSPSDPTLTGASLDLFKGTIFCLLPAAHTPPQAVDGLAALITAIGAKPYYIDPTEHDVYVAGAQQLPVLLSAALMETLTRSGGWREMQPIADTALRTATQLATSDPATTSLNSQGNRAAVERWLNDLIRVLVELRDNLDNRDQIEAILSHARDAHEQWMAAQPNMRPGENDFIGQPEEVGRSIGSLFFGQRRKKPDQRK